MMPEQEDLLVQAQESLAAARLLHQSGYHGFAAVRAYYAMFYVAEAFLLGKDLAFFKHSGVIAAFGEHLSKTGVLPKEFHRDLSGVCRCATPGITGKPKASLRQKR